MIGWLVILLTFGSLAGLIVYRWLYGKKLPGYVALTEYWVYGPGELLPDQTRLMERMISNNPHNRRGRPAIGAREGMVFSDIRLHIGLAKRARNPHIFRPDLFDEDLVPSPEVLTRLASCQSMVKVRYVSESKLTDTRHLQFMPHLADSVAELMSGTVVFDHVMERLFTFEEFHEALGNNNNAERPDFHVRVQWKNDGEGFYAVTHGLRKVGKPEMRTLPQETDQEVLVVGLMMRLAFQLVRKPDEPGPFPFEEYGDTYVFEPGEFLEGRQVVHLVKKQVVA